MDHDVQDSLAHSNEAIETHDFDRPAVIVEEFASFLYSVAAIAANNYFPSDPCHVNSVLFQNAVVVCL